MNRQRRFHIIFAVHYLRYGLLLCLVPMLQALLAFDLDSLWAALRQDAVILLACAAAALALWRATAFRLEDGAVKVTQGVFYRSYHTFGRASIAALEIARPLYCRMLGASRITLYFKTNASPKSYSMFLHKKDAAAVADVLLPVRSDTSVFEPTGFERLSFVMLSANIITSSAFALWGVKQLDEVLGQNFQQIALDTFHEAELFAARYLPTGLAFLVTLGFAVTGFTFLYALLHTAGFKVCRNGGVIISKGGFVTLIERRILVACVSACDVCVTPPARLLRRYPVYLSAGSFRGGDLPVLVYKKGEERTVERLLPNFCPPDGPLCMPARKSPVQYLWQPGTLLALSLALCGVASYAMPQILPMLFVPVVLALAGLLVSLEGFSVKACTKTPTARCPFAIPVFLPGMRFVCSRRIFPIRCWKTHFPSAADGATCGCTCPAGCSTACAAYCNIWRGKSRSRCERRHRAFPPLCRNRTAFYSHS